MTSLVSLPPHVLAKIVGFCDYNTCRDKLGLTNKFLRSFAVQHGQKRGFVFMAADETMHFHNFHFRPDRPASVNPKLSEVFKLLPPFSEVESIVVPASTQASLDKLREIKQRYGHLFKVKSMFFFSSKEEPSRIAFDILWLFAERGVTGIHVLRSIETTQRKQMLKFAKEKNLHIENWQEELQSGADLKPFLKDLVEDNNPAWRHGTLKLKTDRSKNPPQELVIEAFRMFITDACFQDFLIKTLEFEIGYLPRHIPSTKETVERVKDHPLLVYRLDPDMCLMRLYHTFTYFKIKFTNLGLEASDIATKNYTIKLYAKKQIYIFITNTRAEKPDTGLRALQPDTQMMYDVKPERKLDMSSSEDESNVPAYPDRNKFLYVTFLECSNGEDQLYKINDLTYSSFKASKEVQKLGENLPFTLSICRND